MAERTVMRGQKLIRQAIKYWSNTHLHFGPFGRPARVCRRGEPSSSCINHKPYTRNLGKSHTIAPTRYRKIPRSQSSNVAGQEDHDGRNHVIELYHQQDFGHYDGIAGLLPRKKCCSKRAALIRPLSYSRERRHHQPLHGEHGREYRSLDWTWKDHPDPTSADNEIMKSELLGNGKSNNALPVAHLCDKCRRPSKLQGLLSACR